MDILSPVEALEAVLGIIAVNSNYPTKSIGLHEIHACFEGEFDYDINNTTLMLVLDKLKQDGHILVSPDSYTSYCINNAVKD